jgi:hypothetical protein
VRAPRRHLAGGVAAGLVMAMAVAAVWLLESGADEAPPVSRVEPAAETPPVIATVSLPVPAAMPRTRPLVEPDVILPSESVAPVAVPVVDEPGEVLPESVCGRVVRLADGSGIGSALVSIDARAATGFSGFVSERVDPFGAFELAVPAQAHGSDTLRATGDAGGRHFDQSVPLRDFLRSGRAELVVDTGWCLRVSVIWSDEQPADKAQVMIALDESPERPLVHAGPWVLRRSTGSSAEAVEFADLSHELRSLDVTATRWLAKGVCTAAPLHVQAPDGAQSVSRQLVLPCPKPPDPPPGVAR